MKTYFIVTYKALENPTLDGGLHRYADAILREATSGGEYTNVPTLIMNGGATNPALPYTEAECMHEVLSGLCEARGIPLGTLSIVSAHAEALDLWDSLRGLATWLHEHQEALGPVVIFCEKHRERRVKYIAERLLDDLQITIVPVDFDHEDYNLRDRLVLKAQHLSARLSWRFPSFYKRIERPLRLRKIGRDRNGRVPLF